MEEPLKVRLNDHQRDVVLQVAAILLPLHDGDLTKAFAAAVGQYLQLVANLRKSPEHPFGVEVKVLEDGTAVFVYSEDGSYTITVGKE